MRRTIFLLVWALATGAHADPQPVRIYLDAARSGSARASGIAIERGIRTALDEAGGQMGGRPVELVLKDHRASSPRSKRHLEQYLDDPLALAVFAGMHSPPLLAHRDFINEHGVLLLDPWAAAGPITRGPARPRWIFRLSLDDTQAGESLVRHAIDREGFRRPALLLEETGWGDSNLRTLRRALAERGLHEAVVSRFRWGISERSAIETIDAVVDSGADVVFLVANSMEAARLVREMSKRSEDVRLPFRSHWGITGGSFCAEVGKDALGKVDVAFLQTSFSFLDEPLSTRAVDVLERAGQLFPEVDGPGAIEAPVGFIHAYDLTRLLLRAAERIEWSGEAATDRARLRASLEHLETPIEGLVKTYRRPFHPPARDDDRSHEALDLEDIRMARYDEQGRIRLLARGVPADVR